MLKWLIIIFGIYTVIGIFVAYSSSYKPISEQIDVKAMSFTNPSYFYKTFSKCEGTCQNYSSSSSRGGGGGGK